MPSWQHAFSANPAIQVAGIGVAMDGWVTIIGFGVAIGGELVVVTGVGTGGLVLVGIGGQSTQKELLVAKLGSFCFGHAVPSNTWPITGVVAVEVILLYHIKETN